MHMSGRPSQMPKSPTPGASSETQKEGNHKITPYRRHSAARSLPTELDAFYTEHRGCGELDAGVEGPTVWFDCECGARIARRADDGDVLDLNG